MRVITQYGKVKSQPSTRDNAVTLRKNSTGSPITRRKLNLIEGSGVTLTLADDIAGDEADITVASTATSTDRMRWLGDWDSGTTYQINDVVNYADPGPIISQPWPLRIPFSYIALTSNTNKRPNSNPSDWVRIAVNPVFGGTGTGIITNDTNGVLRPVNYALGDANLATDSTTGEITVTLASTGVVADTYTPMVGTVNAKGLLTSASTATASQMYTALQVQRITFAGLVANTTVTLADITGLSFSALASKMYFFTGVLGCVSIATTTGIGFSVSGSAGTITTRGQFSHMTAATTQGGGSWISSNTTKAISTGVITGSELFPVVISGIYSSTSDSTAQFRFRSEIAGSEVNVQTASIMVYQMN